MECVCEFVTLCQCAIPLFPRALTPPGPDAVRLLDSKACSTRGVLHPPPEKDKVAHGDANLDIHDFLAKL